MDDLLREFIAETRETLEALSGEIVAWEATPDDRARLDAIFRFVHTVKGSCGFLDLPRLSRLSHAAEDVLAAVRSGERTPDTGLVNAVLAIVDRIGEIVEAIDAGAALDDACEELLIAALDAGAEAAMPVPVVLARRNPARSVRLSVDLLDRMMSGMSDMMLARNELARRVRDAGADPATEGALERLSATVAEMRDTVTRTRMQKIDALFSALPRMVRDTAAELGKSVTLHLEGGDVELDREMIEMMRDPLVHIVRNAIDHGIEAPTARRKAGKRENARLAVSARQSGNQIIIVIEDDGQGIDTDALVAKAAQGRSRSEADLRRLSEREKLDLIFEAGLTTRESVTAISGRGVGMDVVRANVERIGGRIDLTNTPGKGLAIAIHVPLTLSIIAGIGVSVGDQRFAISSPAIDEIVSIHGEAIRIDMLGSTPVATVRDRRLPLVDLADALGIVRDREAGKLVILSISGGSYALAVDDVLDHEELVVKPAAPAVMATGLYAGHTLPDTGVPMLLLDCAGIAAQAGIRFWREAAAETCAGETEIPAVPALLFDDLDGVRRLVALAAVDRIESVSTETICHSAGRLRLSLDKRIVPLVAQGEWAGRDQVQILRVRDGDAEIGYAIREALDIVDLPETIVSARVPGPVAGVVALAGQQIELLDLFWLFGEHGDLAPRGAAPLCLLDGSETAWMTSFLKPVLESAGYRVTAALNGGDRPDVVLTMDSATFALGASVPVVRLRRDREAVAESDTIYRYDREALLAAISRSSGGAT
ncbi:chemotaxis protein CheA [Sphingomonas panacis]|uniref:Chemotaxis protein CheA n=1 Tax=Sphingomonas panacis TaxID=1560345 RepID=A0A1B3ZDH8_9SPHN|nr:chemotaxis protein CheW [Sphingomonas panacis]AOH85488.1 chemotaxis protein CheA [Sphingomonas panacis]